MRGSLGDLEDLTILALEGTLGTLDARIKRHEIGLLVLIALAEILARGRENHSVQGIARRLTPLSGKGSLEEHGVLVLTLRQRVY